MVGSGIAILETVTTLDEFFYQEYGNKGEYGNLMNSTNNVDFHITLSKVAYAKLEKRISPFNGLETYLVRFLNEQKEIGATFLLMWKPGYNILPPSQISVPLFTTHETVSISQEQKLTMTMAS